AAADRALATRSFRTDAGSDPEARATRRRTGVSDGAGRAKNDPVADAPVRGGVYAAPPLGSAAAAQLLPQTARSANVGHPELHAKRAAAAPRPSGSPNCTATGALADKHPRPRLRAGIRCQRRI